MCSKRTERLKNIQQTAVSEQLNQATKTIQSTCGAGVVVVGGGAGLRTGGADQSILFLNFFERVTNFLIQVSSHPGGKKNQHLPVNENTK